MKIGFVAEFNPFHNGHIYLISEIRRRFPNCEIVVALSSDYVQRGEIACASFSERKEIALQHGVNEVIELDFFTSTQAAHVFAEGSIKKLISKDVDVICFGASDTNNINKYIFAAQTLKDNLEKYNILVKKNLKEGKSYVASTYSAMHQILGDEELIPQDILGFEYTKYIINNNINVKLECVLRTAEHSSLEGKQKYASATLLRKMLKDGKNISQYSPMQISQPIPKIEDKFLEMKEVIMKSSASELAQIMLVSEGVENLFKKNISLAKNYSEFIDLCSSKRYTKSRIKRVLLYVLLGIKKEA
ncbi:nucleotidyltransferase [Metamycoplasma equirhinis]|uniref:nucleotidyltransferase n=1 Tax=Metamycoplasma equirhinis TaxID=92402 RepID=UPI0035946B9C